MIRNYIQFFTLNQNDSYVSVHLTNLDILTPLFPCKKLSKFWNFSGV